MQDMPDDLIVLGFDFGLKHIGVAVGQTCTRTAQALTTLAARNGQPNWNEVAQLIHTWRPNALIVGIPLNMDNTEQPVTHAAKHFAEELATRYPLPIHHVDERLTTVDARERLFAMGGYKALQKKTINSVAAQIIVETWLAEINL
jgi:putative Holliday junction resolvase